MGIFDDNFRDDLASSLNYQAAPIDKPRPTPTGETWQQAGMTQYRGYYYELVDARAGLGVGGPSWIYSLYPPEAAESAFFDYGMVIRVQGGFSQQSVARADVKAWVDGILNNTVDLTDTGSAELIDIGLDPLPFISGTVPPGTVDPLVIIPEEKEEEESTPMTDNERFFLIGVVVLAGLYGFIKK